MLSIQACEKILNRKNKKYTKEQVTQIRALLYKLAEVDVTEFNQKRTK